MATETKIVTEQGHWYTRTGEPFYEIENKSKPGEMRAVTLRDAKKLDLVPSVTTVLQLLAKPGLDQWKQKQVLLSSLTLPRLPDESEDSYVDRILLDAKDQAIKAAEKGTIIHGAIERYLNGETIEPEFVPYVIPVIQEMEQRGMLENRKVEHSFSHPLGFGGKIDYHNDKVLIDFKTKEFAEAKKLAWPEHIYQLGGYRLGLQMPELECFNVFISTSVPGLYHFHQWDNEQIRQGVAVFMQTLELWKMIKL